MEDEKTEPILPQIADVAPDDPRRRALHEENRLSWNEATRAHNSHKRDQAKFFREGGNKLFPEETALLGDLHGKSVLHLQRGWCARKTAAGCCRRKCRACR